LLALPNHYRGLDMRKVAAKTVFMSDPAGFPLTQTQLERARSEVIAWLRDGAISDDPMFMLGHPEKSIEERSGEIAERFLNLVREAGFTLEIVEEMGADGLAYAPRWTHRGSSFVGFKQPESARNVDEAKVLACAALLRNEWCRERLR
jgi:hypothetical protein